MRELASVKQFNTFEEQFNLFRKEIYADYYKSDQVDIKMEGMRLFSNKTYTSKEETTKLDETYNHKFGLHEEMFEAGNWKHNDLITDLSWVKLFSHNLKEDLGKKADNTELSNV